MARNYSNTFAGATLSGGISAGATAVTISSASGLPVSFPYTLTIDDGLPTMEVIEVTNASGANLTVTRGVDGTAAVSHSLGAQVQHSHSARDFREPQLHIDATAAHGATGAVVGTTNTQTVTNKTISAANNTVNGFTASRFITSDGTGQATASQSKTVPSGTVVGTTDTQTLSGKTLTSPTINGAALSGTLSGSPTFSGALNVTGSLANSGGDLAVNDNLAVTGNVTTNAGFKVPIIQCGTTNVTVTNPAVAGSTPVTFPTPFPGTPIFTFVQPVATTVWYGTTTTPTASGFSAGISYRENTGAPTSTIAVFWVAVYMP